MSKVTVKKDDVGVLFSDVLTATSVDFATVSSALFLLSDQATGTAISKTATVANGVVGSCTISYTTVSGDLGTIATYRQEWQLTFSGGAVLTFPNDTYNTVNVIADLN